jgi:protease I
MTTKRCILAALLGLSLTGGAYALPVDRPIGSTDEEVHAGPADPVHMDLMRFLLEAVDDPQALRGARVAIVATHGVDGFDLEVPRRYLIERGATVHVIAAHAPNGAASGAAARNALEVINPSGEELVSEVDRFMDDVDALDYHAVYLPGHRVAPAAMSGPAPRAFLQRAVHAGRPVFAIGNAPLALLEAGLLERKRATGDAATFLRLALSSAAATDAALVNDGPIHTSRNAFDMPVLVRQLVAELEKRLER